METSRNLGEQMRFWRDLRGMSQLDLSLEIEVSQRHISFVESGRSSPSRKLLISISDALNIPLRERNILLLTAGYAPLYQEQSLDATSMAAVMGAIDQMLENHEPHPALLLDRYWNVLRTNKAAPKFFGSFVDLDARPKPRNLIDLMFDPDGLRPFVEDWQTVAAGLLERVRREAAGGVIDDRLELLLKRIKQHPGTDDFPHIFPSDNPVLPITFRKGEERIAYFSLITTVGTPQSITAQELRLECMFPVEPPTNTQR
jgi:transcriptional regulator with XRE-family HTH domain